MLKNGHSLITYFSVFCLLPQLVICQLNNTSANMVMESGAYLVVDNLDFKNNGIFTQTAGTVKFSGTTGTVVSGSMAPQFYNIELNKAGTSLQLQINLGITNQLLFTTGLLNLNNYNITLASAASLNGESETSRITGTTGGYVQIINTLNAPAAVNPGNLGAIITSAQNLGSTIIRRGHVSQTNVRGLGNSIFRYYDIIPTNNSALSATLGINYFNAELNSLDENSLLVVKSTNNTTWTGLGYDNRNTTTNYVNKTNIADLARFTLSTPLNALPLVWGSINTKCANNGVTITWKTLQESNTNKFIVRRSSNGITWNDIGTLTAAGNSNSTIAYTYTDAQAFSGAYYRIAEEDFNGHEMYSPVLRNNCNVSETINVYPNPVYNSCWISLQTESSSPVSLRLYDSKGALVLQQLENVQAGATQIGLRLDNIAHGIYSLVVTWGKRKINTVKIEKR